MQINRVIIAGNLTKDVELRFTANGKALAKASIALNRKFKVGEEQRDETSFVDLECWGKQAEAFASAKKGQNVVLEGRLRQDFWEDKETKQKRSKLVVVIEGYPGVVMRSEAPTVSAPAETPEYSKPPSESDDVPF